jgi:hypothetical protein
MLSSLREIVELNKTVLVAVGGSAVSERRNPTSDTDFFVIADPAILPMVQRLASKFPRSDVEARGLGWLDDICRKLECFTPSLNCGPSQFNFFDLRFLARILTGQLLVQDEVILSRIRSVEERLREALATFMSSFFVSTYEDIVGLAITTRFEEIPVIAGELAQRACLLALLQSRLVDPSPKWSLVMARDSPSPKLSRLAKGLIRHLGSSGAENPKDWAIKLMCLTNSIIGTSMLEVRSNTENYNVKARRADMNIEFEPLPTYCLMGVPGYNTLIEMLENKIFTCNDSFLYMVSKGYLPGLKNISACKVSSF